MAVTTRRVARELELRTHGAIEEATPTAWAQKISRKSKLYIASGSLLHQRTYIAHGRLVRDASHIQPVVQSLLDVGILPDTLIPNTYWRRAPHFTEIRWDGSNDAELNSAEELGDVAYQLIKCWGDRETTDLLQQLWAKGNLTASRALIAKQLSLPENRWLWGLVDDTDKEKTAKRVSDLLVGAMESRSARGVAPIQTVDYTWRKLLSGSRETIGVEERLGEYAELKQAAMEIERQNQHPYAQEVVGDVIAFGGWLDEAASNSGMGVSFARSYAERMPHVIEAFQRLTGVMGFDVSQVVEFGLRKQELRIAVGRTIRTLAAEKGLTLDLRAVPKVAASLFVQYLLATCGIRG